MDLFSHLSHFELCSFGSGSSGNCYYVGNTESAILVDAGINSRSIVKGLEEAGKNIRNIQGILITHDHIDHIKGLPDITQKFNTKVFATAKTWEAIQQNRFTRNVRPGCFQEIESEKTFTIGSFSITPFPVSHDAADANGYSISNSQRVLSIATDLGYISSVAAAYMKRSNILVLESNYDEEMLENGPYPAYLKDRIRGNNGHLSNEQTAHFLAENIHPELTHVFLAHLSDHNNKPEKAINTVLDKMHSRYGHRSVSYNLTALDRKKRSRIYRLTDSARLEI